MCGLVGFVRPAGERADAAEARRLAEVLAHRGPDASGAWAADNVALGHRRLSIIDLSEAANQPMEADGGDLVLIFNGEIYNFQALRAELAAKGHVFRTQSDTEMLLAGWREWGEELVPRLRGMFTFALMDRRAGALFVARDRFGKKPLYWTAGAGGLAFASEPKALLALPWVGRELDLAALGEFMVYGAVAEPRSAWTAIRALPPGSTMTVATGAVRPVPEIRRYWRFTPRPDPRLDEGGFLEELETTLAEAVRLRMVAADVPVGAFLSGGIDSGLVVALMARAGAGPVRTFTIGFDEAGWDEAPAARALAARLGTEHHEERVAPEAIAVLPELIATYDQPFGDPSSIPTWYVSRMTARQVKVALSGDGGDELFLGYRRYLETRTLERAGRRLGLPGRAAAGWLGRRLPTGSFLGRGLDRVARRGFDLYHHALGFSPVYRTLLGPEVAAALGGAEEQKAAAAWALSDETPGLSFLDRCRSVDLETYLPDQILVKVDRAAMAHGLEVRCPLLDAEVAELAARAPADLQLGRRTGKRLLRRLAAKLLPAELLERPKQGFGMPLDRWFRGALGAELDGRLAAPGHPAWRFFDRPAAARRLADHRAHRADAGGALWRLLFFAAWAERSLD